MQKEEEVDIESPKQINLEFEPNQIEVKTKIKTFDMNREENSMLLPCIFRTLQYFQILISFAIISYFIANKWMFDVQVKNSDQLKKSYFINSDNTKFYNIQLVIQIIFIAISLSIMLPLKHCYNYSFIKLKLNEWDIWKVYLYLSATMIVINAVAHYNMIKELSNYEIT